MQKAFLYGKKERQGAQEGDHHNQAWKTKAKERKRDHETEKK